VHLAIDIFAAIVLLVIVVWLLRIAWRRAIELDPDRHVLRQEKLAAPPASLPQTIQFSPEPRFLEWQQSDFGRIARSDQEENAIPEEALSEMPAPQPSSQWVEATTTHSQDGQLNIKERNYADPIDGMLFESGEPVIACSCGLGYRMESVLWLHQHATGRCVQCGAEIAPPVDLP